MIGGEGVGRGGGGGYEERTLVRSKVFTPIHPIIAELYPNQFNARDWKSSKRQGNSLCVQVYVCVLKMGHT